MSAIRKAGARAKGTVRRLSRQTEIDALRAALRDHEADMAGLQASLAQHRTWVSGLEAAVAERDGWVTDLEEALREASDASLHREWVPTGHYYSAVPSREHLEQHRSRIIGQDPCRIPGVDLRLEAQLKLSDDLVRYVPEVPFPDQPDEQWRYYFHNDFFADADGLFLHLLLRHLRPSRVVEVGSGFSSACLLDTAEHFLGSKVDFTFIEPYDERLRSLLRPDDLPRVEILNQGVEDVELSVYEGLAADDLLLIDSTHTVKAGGDVNWLFFEVLPTLAPGVVVHVHDVLPGFEYPWEWLEQGRAWSEAYLLRAFLQYNDTFEVLLWPSLLCAADPQGFAARFRGYGRAQSGGSIYLRRR
jgi:predicted O-methyltransferase YrrM